MSKEIPSIFSVNVRKNETFIEPKRYRTVRGITSEIVPKHVPKKMGIAGIIGTVVGEVIQVASEIPDALNTVNVIYKAEAVNRLMNKGFSKDEAINILGIK